MDLILVLFSGLAVIFVPYRATEAPMAVKLAHEGAHYTSMLLVMQTLESRHHMVSNIIAHRRVAGSFFQNKQKRQPYT